MPYVLHCASLVQASPFGVGMQHVLMHLQPAPFMLVQSLSAVH
jgi:hypothetical protein